MMICEQAGCPVAADGRCLEGFADPDQCPHTHKENDSEGLEPEKPDQDETPDAVASDHELDDLVEQAELPAVVALGGHESLSVGEAEDVAARHAARVVLVAGAFGSGKTCLVAGLYGEFLAGKAADWSFMGSTSLMALDARYHGTRAVTELEQPDSQRTRDEDMRLLDLRLAGPEGPVNLMFCDVRGEYFEDVVSGRPVSDAVRLAARADLLLVALDGSRLADRYERSTVISFARQLVGGLTETGGLGPGIPMALVVTKADKLEEDGGDWLAEQLDGLAEFATQRGLGTVGRFVTAAFPDASHPKPLGIIPLLEWLLADRSPSPRGPVVDNSGYTRSYLRGAPNV